jgi:hypothetical protein
MDYASHFTAHLRITILKLLAGSGYQLNSSLLCDGCDGMGLTVTRDRIKTELAWLAEQQLVTNTVLDHMIIGRLTERGLDVAQGRVAVPGVKTPGP